MRFLYSLSIDCYWFAILLVSPFNKKAALWIKGRNHWQTNLRKCCAGKKNIVCFHCASLGEFEQAKPVIEKYKTNFPNATILVSFFSPSGFEFKKNDPIADIVVYLPLDTIKNANELINIVNPSAFFFIKYEYWYNLMYQLAENKIPFYYISAIFRPSQPFFKPWGKWFAKHLQKAAAFFVQDRKSADLIMSIGAQNVEITGDTRFDRVFAIAKQQQKFDFVSAFKNDKKLLVAGSTWMPDEEVLKAFLDHFSHDYKLLIAPHLIDKEHVGKVLQIFNGYKTICYTEIDHQTIEDAQVLVLDSMGLLSKLYQYGEIAYIGGAFKTGLHNTIEAAVYGIPIFFGTHYSKFIEAIALIERGGAFSIHDAKEMIDKIKEFENDPSLYQSVCYSCQQYVQENLGASNKICQFLTANF